MGWCGSVLFPIHSEKKSKKSENTYRISIGCILCKAEKHRELVLLYYWNRKAKLRSVNAFHVTGDHSCSYEPQRQITQSSTDCKVSDHSVSSIQHRGGLTCPVSDGQVVAFLQDDVQLEHGWTWRSWRRFSSTGPHDADALWRQEDLLSRQGGMTCWADRTCWADFLSG